MVTGSKIPDGAYAVSIVKNANSSFTAQLVDIPLCPVGHGPTEQEAHANLMDMAFPVLDAMQKKGTLPPPRTTTAAYFVLLGNQVPFKAPPGAS